MTASDPGVIHLHGLVRNPADEALSIATHTGLFRMGSSDRSPDRVADLYQDMMGQGKTVYGFGSDWDTREARFLRSDDTGRTAAARRGATF